MSERELVWAFEPVDQTEIHQARLALEAAGIPYVIEGEDMAGGDWLTSTSGTVFRVPSDHLEEAKRVIWEFLKGS